MEEEDITKQQLDRYIRSLAACLAPGPLNGQFVGSGRLPEKFKAILPGHLALHGTRYWPAEKVLERLTLLLVTGLGRDLHFACNNVPPLATMILPEHLPVAKYNEQKWRGVVLDGEATEENCKAAAAKCSALPSATPTGQTAAPVSALKTTPTPEPTAQPAIPIAPSKTPPTPEPRAQTVESPDPVKPASANGLGDSSAPGVTEACVTDRESMPPASPFTGSQASLPSSLLESKTQNPPQLSSGNNLMPYPIQHTFLPSLQALLEEACHGYISAQKQQLIKKNGWSVPQAAELHVYLREIIATWDGSADALTVLKALPPLRHEAVHRVPISFIRMREFFCLALYCADSLGAGKVRKRIVRLRKRFVRWSDKQLVRQELAKMMEERLKHLELVQKEIEKEKLQWEAFALKHAACPEQPGRVELAGLRAAVEPILFPDHLGKEEQEEQEEEEEEEEEREEKEECDYIQLHHGFPRWEIRDDTYAGDLGVDR